MTQTFVFATHNKHKLEEANAILKALEVEIVPTSTDDIDETGTTFEENAIQKALYAFKKTGKPALADDSGLCINALNGRPGIYSARFAEQNGGYPAVFDIIQKEIGENPDRTAYFVCAMALALSETDIRVFVGKMTGSIAHEARGVNGFGYDPIFIPSGYNTPVAQLPNTEKNKISHRYHALQKLYQFLATR